MTASQGAVFLSYASEDAQATQQICAKLRAAGVGEPGAPNIRKCPSRFAYGHPAVAERELRAAFVSSPGVSGPTFLVVA